MTGIYEAKGYYQEEDAALAYESQYRSSLALRNLRAKLVGWGEEKAFARLLNRVPKRGRVLDIACGTERYMETMLRRGYQVGGVDIPSEMLAFAKRRVRHHPNLLFLQRADAERLRFKESQFDVITCMRLCHRVPPLPRSRMFQEVKRLAKGWAILFFGMSTPWLRLRRAARTKLIPGRLSNPYPLTPVKMCRQLEDIGLTVEDYAWVLPGIAEGMVVLVSR